MLKDIEQKIMDIFINVYELKSTNCINENFPNNNIIFDETHIPQKLINKFFIKTKDFIPYILEMALLYALMFNLNDVINKYKELGKSINNIDSLDDKIKRDIVTLSIKYLLNKNNLNSKNIDTIKISNIELFNCIEGFTYIKTINQIYRNIINDLSREMHIDINTNFFERVLLSNEYDENIIKVSKGVLVNENELKHFKLYMTRILLYDAYIFELHCKNVAIKNTTSNIFPPGILPSGVPEELLDLISSTPITKYIKKCINNDKYTLPNDTFLREYIVDKYKGSNNMDKSSLIKEAEANHKNELKKIYPLYILDKLN